MSKNWILAVFIFFLFSQLVHAEQHKIIDKIRDQAEECGSDYFFSAGQINSKSRFKFYKEEIIELLPNGSQVKADLIKSLNLIPVNSCILRGNRNYYIPKGKELLEELQVKNIITMDSIVNRRHCKRNSEHELIYLPVSQKKYPDSESLSSIIEALDYLSEATPEEKTYVSCFFGKHRTGLVVGLYQFLRNYIAAPSETCSQAATLEDEAFLQMNAIANLGILTYDMPSNYLKFYKDFALSVCQEQSQEFLENLKFCK